MGQHTEIDFNSGIKEGSPRLVFDILNYMVRNTKNRPRVLPKHPLFLTDRWQIMLICDSYCFDADTHSTFRRGKFGSWYLCIRSNLKNYCNEIELFIDWVMPYLYQEEGNFLGFYRYEETKKPTLIYYTEIRQHNNHVLLWELTEDLKG